jgi:ABC-type Fe3+ transport system permease subunit
VSLKALREVARLPARADNRVVSNQDPSSTPKGWRKRHSDQNVRPISDWVVAIFLAFLFAIVVLGYLLLTKLADDSRAENCMMEHRKNCGAIEWPSE